MAKSFGLTNVARTVVEMPRMIGKARSVELSLMGERLRCAEYFG